MFRLVILPLLKSNDEIVTDVAVKVLVSRDVVLIDELEIFVFTKLPSVELCPLISVILTLPIVAFESDKLPIDIFETFKLEILAEPLVKDVDTIYPNVLFVIFAFVTLRLVLVTLLITTFVDVKLVDVKLVVKKSVEMILEIVALDASIFEVDTLVANIVEAEIFVIFRLSAVTLVDKTFDNVLFVANKFDEDTSVDTMLLDVILLLNRLLDVKSVV